MSPRSKKKFCWIVFLVIFLATNASSTLRAAPTAEAYSESDQAANESGKRALNGRTNFPWYDSARDDLKRINVKVQKDEQDNRDSQWESTPASTTSSATPVGPSPFLDFITEVMRVLIYLMIGALVLASIFYLVKAYLNRETRDLETTGEEADDEREGEIARVENLPFQVPVPRGDMLSEAERYYMAGDYNQAIVYLFSYELMRLDKIHIIRLTRGKTNRQYVREANADLRLSAILKTTMLAFEDAFFGHHILSRERFEECWYELGEFQRLTRPEVEVAV